MTPKVNHPILLMPQEAKININLFAWSHLNLSFNLNFLSFFFLFRENFDYQRGFYTSSNKILMNSKEMQF